MDFSIDKEGLISLLFSLIRQPTINPPGNEYLTKEIVIESMKKLKAKIKVIGEKNRPNIIGEIGEGKPVIAILSHMDVVPPGEGWNTNPFEPVIKNGRIYGRGAEDDKGPYSASWAAVKAFLESKKNFSGKIILGAVADEERGSEKGIKLLLKNGFKPDFCLIPDAGKWDEAVIGEKGALWIKIKVFGKTSHGSKPQEGINAIWLIFESLKEIEKEIKFFPSHPLFTPITMNLGKIIGGDAPNMVPSFSECIIDIRYPLGVKEEEILSKIKSILSKKTSKTSFEVKILQRSFPHLIDKKNIWIKKFQESANDLGIPLKLTTTGGNTVAKILNEAGIISFSHSPQDIPSAHKANESISIEKLLLSAKLWAGFLSKVFNDRKNKK